MSNTRPYKELPESKKIVIRRHALAYYYRHKTSDRVKQKLNQDEVLTIFHSPLTHREIASQFSISHSHVWSIKHKRQWRWLLDNIESINP